MNTKNYLIPILAISLFVTGIILSYFYSNVWGAGEFVLSYFAAGQFAAGIFSAGIFSVGIFSIGIFSVGIFSLSVFNVSIFGIGLFIIAWRKKYAKMHLAEDTAEDKK